MRKKEKTLFFWMALCSLALSGQKIKEMDLPEMHRDFLKLTAYILHPQEREVFLNLIEDRTRDIFIETFWKQRDPTPGTPENEFKDEHLKRFSYANKHFGRGTTREGWVTDMGRIHIILGLPASIERFEITAGLYPTQVWYYYGDTEKGLPPHFGIIFFQRGGVGEYKLYDHTADGPASLMVHTRTANSMDFSQLYDDLRSLAPTLADIAFSMIPGEIPNRYLPSPMNAIIMADIFQSPTKRIDPAYATHFMDYKGIVSTEYLTNFIESEAFVTLIKDPLLGLNFLHFSIVPKHLSVDYYEPKDQYYCNFTMDVSLRLQEDIIFQYSREFPIYFAPQEFERIKATGIAFEDSFPVIDGEFLLTILLRNSVGKEFSICNRNVAIAEEIEKPHILGPFVGYGIEKSQREIHIPFKFQDKKIIIDPKNTFSSSEEIHFFLNISNVSEGLWKDGRVDVSVSPLGPNKAGTKSFSLNLHDYPQAKTMTLIDSMPARTLSPEYYEIKCALSPGGEEILDEKRANFIISPAETVTHPTAYLNGFPLSESHVFFYMLARQHDQTKNYGGAEAAYERAFRAKPDYKKGLIEYADFLFKIQKFDRSLELIEGVREESDLKFAYFFIKGKALMGIEKHDEAIKNFLEGNQIYNSDIGLLNALGFCYYKTGQKEKALEVLGASIKMNPQQPDVKELIDKIER